MDEPTVQPIGVPVSAGVEAVYDPTPYERNTAPTPKEIPSASEMLKGNTREEDELYCDYRARLYWENLLSKQYFAGKTLWIGKERGPMYNTDRLRRTNRKLRKIEARQARKN